MVLFQRPCSLDEDIRRYSYFVQTNSVVYLRLELLHFVGVMTFNATAIPNATEVDAGCMQLTNVDNIILTCRKTHFRIPSGISGMTERGKILESVDVVCSMHNGFGSLDDSIPEASGNGVL